MDERKAALIYALNIVGWIIAFPFLLIWKLMKDQK